MIQNKKFYFALLGAVLFFGSLSIVNGYQDGIYYSINKGEVLFYKIEQDPPSIVFDIRTFTNGDLSVFIPRSLLDSTDGYIDKDFKILVDTKRVRNYEEIVTEYSRHLNVPIPVGTSKVTIVGTALLNEPDSVQNDLIRINTYPDIFRIHNPHIWNNDMNVEIIIDGDYQEDGHVLLTMEGTFASNYPSRTWVQEGWVTPGNPVIIFDMTHPSNSYFPGTVYDLTATHGKYTKTIQYVPIPSMKQIHEDLSEKERSVKLLDYRQGKVTEKYITSLEVCAGKKDLTMPIIQMNSDVAIRQLNLQTLIDAGSCIKKEFAIKANDPKTITAFFLEKYNVNMQDTSRINSLENEASSLEEDIILLEEELAKKEMLIKEQIKTINKLLAQIKGAK